MKQNEASRRNGVVGSRGSIIPTIPNPTAIKPQTTKKALA
jgi:hypothetical protein